MDLSNQPKGEGSSDQQNREIEGKSKRKNTVLISYRNQLIKYSNENDWKNGDFQHKYQTADHNDEFSPSQPEICDRPPSRQKEPSLALGIGSEYGEDVVDEELTNKISSEIILTTGIPAPQIDFASKYTPAQGKRGAGIDLRPPSRHKTPTKLMGLDDRPKSPNNDQKEHRFQDENNDFAKTNEPKNENRRKGHTLKARRIMDNKCTNFLEGNFSLPSHFQKE